MQRQQKMKDMFHQSKNGSFIRPSLWPLSYTSTDNVMPEMGVEPTTKGLLSFPIDFRYFARVICNYINIISKDQQQRSIYRSTLEIQDGLQYHIPHSIPPISVLFHPLLAQPSQKKCSMLTPSTSSSSLVVDPKVFHPPGQHSQKDFPGGWNTLW